MKTPEEVQQLQANWHADPIWDIEDTDGFEEYREVLIAYRQACEIRWQGQAEYRNERSTQFNVDQAVKAIADFNHVPGVSDVSDILALAQVHATLALVAELKRSNDLKEGA